MNILPIKIAFRDYIARDTIQPEEAYNIIKNVIFGYIAVEGELTKSEKKDILLKIIKDAQMNGIVESKYNSPDDILKPNGPAIVLKDCLDAPKKFDQLRKCIHDEFGE